MTVLGHQARLIISWCWCCLVYTQTKCYTFIQTLWLPDRLQLTFFVFLQISVQAALLIHRCPGNKTKNKTHFMNENGICICPYLHSPETFIAACSPEVIPVVVCLWRYYRSRRITVRIFNGVIVPTTGRLISQEYDIWLVVSVAWSAGLARKAPRIFLFS